jgi:hypothetical protein
MRMPAMVGLAVAAAVALVACDPQEPKEHTGAEPSRASASQRTTPAPSSTPSATPSTAPSRREQSTPRTTEGAIGRYEQYLHALGREDIDTVCEIAGPGAKKAQDEGLGPCTSTFAVVFQMISPVQKKALRTATVDPRRVIVQTPGTVEIPVEAVRASVTFSETELGSSTLEYLKDEWYITG